MSTRATGTFDLDTWDEQPYDERDGTKLTRTRVTKTFRGDLEGTSTAELRGLRGEDQIVREPDGGHTLILDHDLES